MKVEKSEREEAEDGGTNRGFCVIMVSRIFDLFSDRIKSSAAGFFLLLFLLFFYVSAKSF